MEHFAEEAVKLRRRCERERNARLAAEAIAEKGLRDLYEKQQQLQLLEAIAVAANQSASVNEALQFALTAVCQSTGWPVGHAHLVLPAEGRKWLRSTGVWHGRDTEHMRPFFSATETTDFEPGTGLPGRVLASAGPAWIADIAKDCNFPRAQSAQLSGIRASFAFPVLAGNDVAAVLEFFAQNVIAPDELLLRVMSQIGTQLGRVFERKRAENELIHDHCCPN